MNLLNSINSPNPPSQTVIIDTYNPFFTVSLITKSTLRVTIINKIPKYPIYRLYSGGVYYGSVGSIGVINASGFTPNTSYDLTVVASNTTNPATTTIMKTSAITTITTDDAYIPAFDATNIDSSSFTIVVNNVFSKYTLYTLYEGNYALSTAIGSSATGVIDVTGLVANTGYALFIIASNDAGATRVSAIGTVTTDVNFVPEFLVAAVSATSLLATIAALNATYINYALRKAVVNGGATTTLATTTTTTATATGLAAQTQYLLFISATNSGATKMKTSAPITYYNAVTSATSSVVFTANSQTISTVTAANYLYMNGAWVFSTSQASTNAYVTGNPTNITEIQLGTYIGSATATLKGTYTGVKSTTVSGVAILGEWYQVNLPYNLYLSSYYLAGAGGSVNRLSSEWTLAGSNDGVIWNYVHNYVILQTLRVASGTYTLPSICTTAYNYFRLIITRTSNGLGSGSLTSDLTVFNVTGDIY